jgi:uncharacterized caspase-like protein
MKGAGTRLNIVILDACRTYPFAGHSKRSGQSGLAEMEAPDNTLIAFATQPGSVALDGSDGDSPFPKALARILRQRGRELFATFNEVGREVMRATEGKQQPWISVSPIAGSFYFNPEPRREGK